MQPTRRSYDLVADRYAREIGAELAGKPLDRALLDAFAELAGTGPLLDVGCGPGQVGRYLGAAGRQVIGLDLSPAMCLIAAGSTGMPAAAADMTALPVSSGVAAGLVCLYAVIHLDAGQRASAYAEFARVLGPGGYVLVAFHTSDAELPPGAEKTVTSWWDQPVELTFRFLEPAAEIEALARAGLELVARLDRQPAAGVEHPSQRCYLLARRS